MGEMTEGLGDPCPSDSRGMFGHIHGLCQTLGEYGRPGCQLPAQAQDVGVEAGQPK